ncbi:MAG: hypothetical protein FD153_1806 [Rhodospirillaceae bacterium]|nr:MAG: hypothetical protein FD153_1806 [Rhodospirillaceae bacterium]
MLRGTINDLIAFIRHNRIDDVTVTLPWSADGRIAEIVRRLDELLVNVHLSSDLVAFTLPRA